MEMTPQDIYQLVAPELALVEEELLGYTRSEIKPIAEIGGYLLNAGGKRLRPALLLLKNLEVLNTLIEITQKMVEGEMLQLTYLGKSSVTEQELLDIVERKTAYLFSGCTKLPALAAGMNHGSAERLSDIGKSLGMAFQLVDDLLDLTSTKAVLGKPVANDLKEGKMTLPVLYAIRNGNREAALKVQQVLDDRDFRTVDRSEILKIVEQSEGLERTRKIAEGYAHRAIQMISEFPPSIYREAMERIPHFILNRNA